MPFIALAPWLLLALFCVANLGLLGLLELRRDPLRLDSRLPSAALFSFSTFTTLIIRSNAFVSMVEQIA